MGDARESVVFVLKTYPALTPVWHHICRSTYEKNTYQSRSLRQFENSCVLRKPKGTGTNSRHPSNSHGNGPTSPDESSESDSQADRQEDAVPVYDNQERSSNFDNTLVRFKIIPASEESLDLMNFLANRN